MISNSRFHGNSKSGIKAKDVVGQSRIVHTVVSENGGVGLHINGTQGTVMILSSLFLKNKGRGIEIANISGITELRSVNSSLNQGSGIVLTDGAIHLHMTDCHAYVNYGQGLQIGHQVASFVIITDSDLSRNQYNGIYMHDLEADVNLTSLVLDGNSINGIFVERVHKVHNYANISTSYNRNNGLYVTLGENLMVIKFLRSVGNNRHGLLEGYKGGQLYVEDSFISANQKNGIQLDVYRNPFDSFHLQNCSILSSGNYGILIQVSCGYFKFPADLHALVVGCTVGNNSLGGFYMNPVEHSSLGYERRYQRAVQLLLLGNTVSGNKQFGVDLRGPEWYDLNALLQYNRFEENFGVALRFVYENTYYWHKSYPVNVQVISNVFSKNKGERVLMADFRFSPPMRYAEIKNNTFEGNIGVVQTKLYYRSTTHACLVIGEGNFSIERNVFDNPLYLYDLAVTVKDHERVFKAAENWWGAADECFVKKRIFDFQKRVQLAYVEYYPYLMSPSLTVLNISHSARPSCFLNESRVGGTLSHQVTLVKDKSPYHVNDDVIILPNGSLTIEESVSLEFAPKVAFVVQGRVIVKGAENKRVRFIPKRSFQEEIRLVEGSVPWKGKLEIFHNNTWMSACVGRYHYLTPTVCPQLGYEMYTWRNFHPTGNETFFIHNVRCSPSGSVSIDKCNKENWVTSRSCYTYVVEIECKQPLWGGVHLTMATRGSTLKNLDIEFAGFDYRDDSQIPVVALRIDFGIHNIQGLVINNFGIYRYLYCLY